MINGTGTISLRKSDLSNQKIAASGQKRTVFAHKASAGATGISLNSLTIPTEMSSIGFVNPSASDLANLNLLFNRSNLILVSSARGLLMDYVSYSVAGSTQINFNGFTALEGEIFTGIIQIMAQGARVVDASPIIATGTLAATTTDFNVGTPFELGKYSSQQVGAVLVFLDGVQQFRNTGNQASPADGNYYELSAGAGLSTVIRFNQVDLTNDRNILVLSNGLLAERPDGSMMAIIEAVNGKLNNMATYVAALAGVSTTTVQGAAPTNPDLKAFGDKVTTLQQLETTPGSGLPKLATSSVAGAVKVPNSRIVTDAPNGFGSTNTRIRKFTSLTVTGTAISVAANPSVTGEAFTINENGIYSFVMSDRSGVTDQLGFSLNSTQLSTDIRSITAAHVLTVSTFESGNVRTVSWTGYLNAGDIVRPHSSDGTMNGTETYLKCFVTQLFRS